MSPAVIAVLLSVLAVRALGAIAFIRVASEKRASRHMLLVIGWLVYAAAPLSALLLGYDSPLFGATAAAGLLILAPAAFAYFRRIQPLPILGGAAAAGAAVILLGWLWPPVVTAVGPAVQAGVLITATVAAFVTRKMFRERAPRSFSWLVILLVIAAIHSLGFVAIYPSDAPALPFVGTLTLSLAGILFFLNLDSELESRALVESEGRFRAVFEQASVGIVEIDLDGRIRLANPILLDILQYPTEEIAGMPFLDLIAPEDRAATNALMASVKNGHASTGFIEARTMRKDATRLWLAISISLALSAHEQPADLIVIVKDIDERKQLQAELEQHRTGLESLVEKRTQELEKTNEELQSVNEELKSANDDLEHANGVKADFMAKMSHELRTPLNSVIGFTGIVLQELAGPINKEQDKQLRMANAAGKRLLELVNDLLDLSRLETRHLEPHCELLNMGNLCTELHAIMKAAAEDKRLDLLVLCEHEAREICSDRRYIYQIMTNLLGNAIKFTSEGEITLTIRDAGPDMVALHVIDTGPGIPEQEMTRIFEPFVQLDPDRTTNRGTGLGLAISKQLAELLGGELSVTSVVGEGSDFCVTLPHRLDKTPT